MLFVDVCPLRVGCCLPFAIVGCVLCVTCCLYVVCCMLVVVCCWLVVAISSVFRSSLFMVCPCGMSLIVCVVCD